MVVANAVGATKGVPSGRVSKFTVTDAACAAPPVNMETPRANAPRSGSDLLMRMRYVPFLETQPTFVLALLSFPGALSAKAGKSRGAGPVPTPPAFGRRSSTSDTIRRAPG